MRAGMSLASMARPSPPQGHLRVSSKTPSEEQALNAQVRELQRMLGTRLQEAETLRDAVELARGPAAWPGASITHAP